MMNTTYRDNNEQVCIPDAEQKVLSREIKKPAILTESKLITVKETHFDDVSTRSYVRGYN